MGKKKSTLTKIVEVKTKILASGYLFSAVCVCLIVLLLKLLYTVNLAIIRILENALWIAWFRALLLNRNDNGMEETIGFSQAHISTRFNVLDYNGKYGS
jgi:hypothetical protein